MAMSYGDVYVAQIAMGANITRQLELLLRQLSWAKIIAYSPCISHGIKQVWERV